jgi:hypothetical protein
VDQEKLRVVDTNIARSKAVKKFSAGKGPISNSLSSSQLKNTHDVPATNFPEADDTEGEIMSSMDHMNKLENSPPVVSVNLAG